MATLLSMNARTPGRKAPAFIFITVLLDTIGFGIMIPASGPA